ncbi:hypothetical protein DEJ23_10265 [Curtobacterium sp. MCSS17_008]|uniref:TetR/AcrR family transcriptional regulator n=1 Tax=Curtobacterium sp. MCSS17_008 TaxID=2175647 RepID=UPI000DA7321E|nr:TetR/AcrR family transcriptional regulator [Curtobacterium sp. MCSS17_008]PZF56251.1 hypothetical protein DEJ23_10265 [Curtobacterium sp. MCSS17_008]
MTLLTLTPARRETAAQSTAAAAADTLFAEHGFGPVGLRQVADRAGMTLAQVERAYPTKRALVVAVLQRWHAGWRRAVERLASTADDPRDEVLGVFGYLEERFEDEDWRGCAFIGAHAELGRQDPGLAALAREHFLDVERHLTLVCERGGMPAHIAQGLTLLVQGARVDAAVRRSSQAARSARLTAALLMSVHQARPAF